VGGTHLENVSLEVSAHHCSGDTDNQGRERIKATPVTGGLHNGIAISAGGFQRRGGHCCKPTPQATRLETHSEYSCEPKHDSDTYMLNLLGGIWVAGMRAKSFHPCIGYPVHEDHQRLDKFRRDRLAGGCTVPCPAKLGEGSKETSKTEKTVAPKNTALWSSELVDSGTR